MIWLTPKEHEAISAIYDYLIHDEQKHWEELNKPKDHIYTKLRTLRRLAMIFRGQNPNIVP